MPKLPVRQFRATTTNDLILNAIRKNASLDYQRRVPEATKANVKDTISKMMNYNPTRNEFIDALVNQIGMVIVRSNNWTNPLGIFKRGMLEFGDTIEEIQVGLVPSYVYDTDRDHLEKALFGQHRPNVQASIHKINRQEYYAVTINNNMLKRAFTSDTGLVSLVNEIMASPTISDNYDEFLNMTSLFKVYNDSEGFFKVNVPDISNVDTSTEALAKVVLKKVRAMAGNLAFLSPHYNASGMHVAAPKERLVLFLTPEALASIDVDALAAAFNMSRAEIEMRVMPIPSTSFNIPGAQAILTTEDFFVVADTLYETTSQPNPVGLTENYFLHHHQVLSVSRFVPAVLFTTEDGTEIADTLTPVSGMSDIEVRKSDALGNVEAAATTEVTRGGYHQVLGSAITTPDGGLNTGVVLTISGAESPRTYITQTGTLLVALDESALTLTITATSVEDDSFSAEATVTVVGEMAALWPDPEVSTPVADPPVED